MQKTATEKSLPSIHLHQKGITGSTLKIIAITVMLLDHIGAVLLSRAMQLRGAMEVVDQQTFLAFLDANAELYYANIILRTVGRIAFPIFCFLLVQGFLHTHDLKKYLSRLFLFALLSEIPYDLAMSGTLFAWDYQNVYFTLFLGVSTLSFIQLLENKKDWHVLWRVLGGVLAVAIGAGVAKLLKADYDLLGVFVITLLYIFRRKKTLSMGLSCVVLMQPAAFVSLLPVYLYNGERGSNIKWLFYLFYPVHLCILYVLASAVGLAQVLMN